MFGKLVSGFVGAMIATVAIGAGLEVANQAGVFWGLVTGMLVVLFGLLALAGLVNRSSKG